MAPGGSFDLYTEFFGLSRRPFALTPDPAFVYWSKLHQLAFVMLEFGYLNRAPITLLTGEIGAGKSTLMHHLLNTVGQDMRVGLVSNAQGDRGELLHWVLMSLDLSPEPSESYVQLFARFQRFLIDEYAKGRRVLLVIDEAQNMSRDSLEELRMLTNINSGSDELVQLLLVGQPELRDMLRQPGLRQFAQRVAASVHLPAMDAEMTAAYLDHRVRVAGATREIFRPDAAALIHDSAGGVPRLINQLADLSMVYAYTNDSPAVTRKTVEQVIDDGMFFGAGLPAQDDAGPRVLQLRHPGKTDAE